jgi:hypothetical protein
MSLKDFFTGKQPAASGGSGAAPAGGAASGGAGTAASDAGAAPNVSASVAEAAPAATAATPTAAAAPAAPAANGAASATNTAAQTPPQPPSSPLSGFTGQMQSAPPAGGTDALNSQIVQSVQMSNSETAAYASSQIAVAPNMMITQASGLVAQSAANYFDGASKLALASKGVLLKNMTEKLVAEDIKGAAEDALGVLITDLLVGTAAAVAAAAGAIEGEAAHFALDKIDQSLNKYQALLDKRRG